MAIRKVTTDLEDEGTLAAPPAGLPSRDPTRSYWLAAAEGGAPDALRGHRGTEELPGTADVVVVGSGITGAFAAWFLKMGFGAAEGEGGDSAGGKGRRVVMLEAREACSGATGRNGGHCQPMLYGSEPAVAAFELEVFEFLEKFVEEHGVDCDWATLGGVHAFLSDGMFQLAASQVEKLKESHPELGAEVELVRPSDPDPSTTTHQHTLASLRVPTAKGVVIQKKAASLWPYKLVAFVLQRLISSFPAPSFNLQTNTPAISLTRADDGAGWTITTPRGSITAATVLLATNGYTSHLLPAFADLIVPVRGQIGALLPPRPDNSNNNTDPNLPAKLAHTYVFAADPDVVSAASAPGAPRDDYLVQRPLPGGELIYGGGRRVARGLGVGEWRDDELEGDVAGYLRGNLAPPLDLTPGEVAARSGKEEEGGEELEASFEWTGIMGYSRDHHAWVGPVPESLGGGGAEGGLWICAGYTGHGMPAAALSAREVVRQMVGGKAKGEAAGEEGGGSFPREFVMSEERVGRARGLPHLTQGWEATNFASLLGGFALSTADGEAS